MRKLPKGISNYERLIKENYIYVSISGKEDGKESTKFVRLKNDLSATDVLESESLVPTDLINNINLEK